MRHAAAGEQPPAARDDGPYATAEQALAQFASGTQAIAGSTADLANHVVRHALLIAAVDLSVFEVQYLRATTNAELITPVHAQLSAGWIVRAFLTGRNRS